MVKLSLDKTLLDLLTIVEPDIGNQHEIQVKFLDKGILLSVKIT